MLENFDFKLLMNINGIGKQAFENVKLIVSYASTH